MKNFKHHVAKWKWVIIIMLVIAMPLFFSYYRSTQLNQTLNAIDAPVQNVPNTN